MNSLLKTQVEFGGNILLFISEHQIYKIGSDECIKPWSWAMCEAKKNVLSEGIH